MFYRFLLSLALSLFTFTGFCNNLSEQASISLITCGPGNDLYATFGHSALHVFDPQKGIDRVYNYGTFDFDTPNFYMKFARGKLNYFLNVSSFQGFISTYQYEGRWVKRQELNLTLEEEEKLFQFLEINALPENRFYQYDFFYDNCSTRIRDAILAVLGHKIDFPSSETDTTATFREMIDLYLYNHPWSDLGIDLALGVPCDEEADYFEKMFLPDFLMNHMGEAKIQRNGVTMPLVLNERVILEEARKTEEPQSIAWLFWVIFGSVVLAGLVFPARFFKGFDIALFSLTGILGLAIVLLWFATDHSATKYNLNLWWALPSWLLGAGFLIGNKAKSRFFKIHAILTFSLIVAWWLIPQSLHVAVIPWVVALTARSWAWQKQKFQLKKMKGAG